MPPAKRRHCHRQSPPAGKDESAPLCRNRLFRLYAGVANLMHDLEPIARSVLDSLSAHVAILDRDGNILWTNAAWKSFARSNDIRMRPDTVQVNYLDICQSALGDSADQAADVYLGIRNLLEGRIDEFVIDYPCHSPEEQRWFYMRATRLNLAGAARVVVSHENITPLKLSEQALQQKTRELEKREQDLKSQAESLADANTALRVLLDQREQDRKTLEMEMASHLRHQVLPFVDTLAETRLDARQENLLRLIRDRLDSNLAPLLQRSTALEFQLTRQELKIAVMIREGRTTKDIAGLLNVSTDAIEFHRKNIRRKLGLTGNKVNLCTHLRTLTP